MMKHTPMNSLVSICSSAAQRSLYLQTLSAAVILLRLPRPVERPSRLTNLVGVAGDVYPDGLVVGHAASACDLQGG
jgi:hypothetical protein